MKVELDFFEMYYLLESCFRGSHLRSGTIRRFVDEWYGLFTPQQRKNLRDWILRDIYNGDFKPNFSCCGEDEIFMARYDPDNQYRVTVLAPVEKGNGKNVGGIIQEYTAFLRDGKYYTKSDRYIAEEYITSVEKIPPVED